MSGGHWQYLAPMLQEKADDLSAPKESPTAYGVAALRLLARIELTLDRGICGDDCSACAERNTLAMLECFFDSLEEHRDPTRALGDALPMSDRRSCDRCKAFDRQRALEGT